jgi:hypothetical protein
VAVSFVPPCLLPPTSVTTAGLLNMSLTDCTNRQAYRYEISSERAAAVIEPFATMASSSAILVGPNMAPFGKHNSDGKMRARHCYQKRFCAISTAKMLLYLQMPDKNALSRVLALTTTHKTVAPYSTAMTPWPRLIHESLITIGWHFFQLVA